MSNKSQTTTANQIDKILTELRLPSILDAWQESLNRAIKDEQSPDTWLLTLLEIELMSRYNKRISKLIKQSHLPVEKTLHSYDFKRLPVYIKSQIAILKQGQFIKDKANILCFGNPGSGKTHLMCGIALHLASEGFKVSYHTCAILVQELLIAKKELRLPKLIKQLIANDLLILDEIGYVEQERSEMEVLFTLLSECYETTSILLTSNLPFSQWDGVFKDKMMTAAVIDRLIHHSVVLELNLPSYRIEMAKINKEALAKKST
jgi:DNA replication protein DnaC